MLARIRKAKEEREGGFTLIELLVVIIIIGILAAIAIPVFLNQRKKGYDSQAKADLRNLATAEETYLTENPTSYRASTAPATDLATQGFNKSANVNIAVAIDGANGFCSAATSSSGSTFWYDSQAGGLQAAASATKPTTTTCNVVTLAAPATP
jgi:type IV pilus assembly protein PilA